MRQYIKNKLLQLWDILALFPLDKLRNTLNAMKGKGINRQPLRQTGLSVRISIIIETCPVNSVVF